LPHQGDHPENPSTLPNPELNPLQNPTLGKHMGRWAEVYFNSPPEKRDEAVQQLVRELESEAAASESSPSFPSSPLESSQGSQFSRSQEAGAAETFPRSGGAATSFTSTPSSATGEEAHSVTCFWCGYVNQSQYKFCGRCGETLGTYDIHGQLEHPRDASSPQPGAERPLFASPQAAKSAAETEDFLRQKIHGFRSLENSPTLHLGLEPTSRSFRPWFAAVLAAILVALIYVAWRGTPSRPQASSSPAQLGPPHSFAEPATNAAPNRYPEAPAPPAKTAANGVSPNSALPTNTPAPNTAVTPAENGSGTAAPGAEELAQARDFLDGTHGRQRNPSEAAQWLWKAVRQENAEATVLLADLYLRGDGVAKNCEQAHLLLDAAAIKGRKEAATRLQNLPAFGCQ
jgi:hypothetical protein